MARIVPGSGADIDANFDSNFGIASFTINNGGTGYATTDPPQITITGTTTPSSVGSFYPIIQNGVITSIKILSPGAGYIPLVALATTAVGISSIGVVGTDTVVREIYVKDPGSKYSSPPPVTISDPEGLSGFGTYYFNEVVIGSRSKTEARVKDWDQDTKILKVAYVSIGSTQLGFFPGETITGKESGAAWPLLNYNDQDTYDKYTENDEFETLGDALLDFSESNPFGTY